MKINLKEIFSLHPFLFSIFPIIFIFSINSQEIKFEESIILIIIILNLTFGIVFGLGLIFTNKKAPSFVVSIGFLLFFSYGHIYNLITSSIEIRHIFVIVTFVGFFIISVIYFVRTQRRLNNATKIANGIAVVLIIISGTNIISDNIQGNYSLDIVNAPQEIKSISSQISDKPDVYYIILDAYAGKDALNNYFGYSNDKFISFLKENNFYVVPNAQTNYPTTTLSLASSLNMKHLECVQGLESCITPGIAYQMIQNNEVMKRFNAEGYTIINSYSGWTPTRNFDIAFSNLCGRYSGIMNSELAITIISNSILNPIYVKLFEDVKREQILCVLQELEEVHHRYDKPIFVFSHLVLPHSPYVFGPNGEEASPEKLEIAWEGLEKDKEGYLNQLKFANKKFKQIITRILAESEIPPIIIIQGDHGLKSKIEDFDNPTEKELQERFSILNAYHIPNETESIYPNITPVNSFRMVMNELFNHESEMLLDSSHWLNKDSPASFEEISSILRQNLMN
jgi:hypothetical protein